MVPPGPQNSSGSVLRTTRGAYRSHACTAAPPELPPPSLSHIPSGNTGPARGGAWSLRDPGTPLIPSYGRSGHLIGATRAPRLRQRRPDAPGRARCAERSRKGLVLGGAVLGPSSSNEKSENITTGAFVRGTKCAPGHRGGRPAAKVKFVGNSRGPSQGEIEHGSPPRARHSGKSISLIGFGPPLSFTLSGWNKLHGLASV